MTDAALADIELVVLAGGRGARLGGDKSRILLRSRPILSDLLDRLDWPGPTLLVTARPGQTLAGGERFTRAVADRHPGEGPLGGIVTALGVTLAPRLVVLPIDLCELRQAHVRELLDLAGDASIAAFDRPHGDARMLEPLPLCLRATVRSFAEATFAAGRRAVRALFDAPDARIVPAPAAWPASIWANLNDPDALRAAGGALAP